MSTVIIKGSPRKNGNSTYLAEVLGRELEEQGEQVEYISLRELKLSCCVHCEACRKKETCVIDDDMQSIYRSLDKCDKLVIAAPIYWFNVNAQTKIFLDRLYALAVKRSQFSWKVGIILTGEGVNAFDSGAVNAFRAFQDMFSYLQADIKDLIFCSSKDVGDAEKNVEALDQTRKLAKRMV